MKVFYPSLVFALVLSSFFCSGCGSLLSRQRQAIHEDHRALLVLAKQLENDLRSVGCSDPKVYAGDEDSLLYVHKTGCTFKQLSVFDAYQIGGLSVRNSKVVDLGPLRKQKHLVWLNLSENKGISLKPLDGMSFQQLNLSDCGISDLKPLKGVSVKELNLSYNPVKNISPLRGKTYNKLALYNTEVRDLSPLSDMKVQELHLESTKIKNLIGLENQELVTLFIEDTAVADLSPLKGLPLKVLYINDTQVRDLSPLAGMDLETLSFTPEYITNGLSVLRGMNSLEDVNDMPADDFWKKMYVK